ncbi:MAG TPA: hypothetical protein VN259_03360, partial [Xanthomonadales bacterium]|nr:hypothetical protein [Xanthomonadales bacterium]
IVGSIAEPCCARPLVPNLCSGGPIKLERLDKVRTHSCVIECHDEACYQSGAKWPADLSASTCGSTRPMHLLSPWESFARTCASKPRAKDSLPNRKRGTTTTLE